MNNASDEIDRTDYDNVDLLTAEIVRRYEPKGRRGYQKYDEYICLHFRYGGFLKFKLGSGKEKPPEGQTRRYEHVMKQWHSRDRFAGMEGVLKKGFEGNGRT